MLEVPGIGEAPFSISSSPSRRGDIELLEFVVHEAIDEGLKTFDATATPPALLATWEVQLRKFVKVMPRDYKRALAELAAETAAVA